MTYREDKDLEFLRRTRNEDLAILVDYLIYDKKGNPRLVEHLTISDGYKLYYPDHQKYWKDIAEELQLFGGNTLASYIFRGGKGVSYREILIDVCKKLKVNFNKNSDTETIEQYLLQKIMIDSLDKMTSEELQNLVRELGVKPTNLTKQGLIAALQVAIKMGGFTPYKLAVIVANAVAKAILGKGLTLAANSSLTRSISIFAGPIGWIITALWTLYDIAGPAYRVTIPSVIQVAYMRLHTNYLDNIKEEETQEEETQEEETQEEETQEKEIQEEEYMYISCKKCGQEHRVIVEKKELAICKNCRDKLVN